MKSITTLKIFTTLAFLSSIGYANDCPKWFPMMTGDIIVVMPIYDESITGADMDCDGLVDTVDPDIDGDGVVNASDAFPTNPTEWADTDSDGVGNNADKPRIALLAPNNGANNVLANANLSVTYDRFDTSISKVAGKYFKIFLADGTEHTNFNVSVAQVNITGGNTVTVNPNTHLIYGKTHYVHIDAGAFKDSTGEKNEGIQTNYRWNFTVQSGSGPCGCDDFDNCDVDASLQ